MNIVPDTVYNPEFRSTISSKTKLAPGISLSRFLGGYGDQVTLGHISSQTERLKLAKQFYLQAKAMLTITQNAGEFKDFRLVVAEGLYRRGPSEQVDIESVNGLSEQGRAVVYELRDKNGDIALTKTFDLAVYWMNTLNFEKLILDYDTFNPDGSLNAQIILIMPRIIPPWQVTYKNIVETRFNSYVQSTNELVECLPEPRDTSPKISS